MRRPTVETRCLLYLLDRADVWEESPAAQQLVQDRIAEALGIRRAHVSRAMIRLRDRGFVKGAKVHVKGRSRRRSAYFLTEDGLRRAREVRRRTEEERVIVVGLEGQESENRLYEVPRLLPRRPKFSDLVAAVKDGRLDLRHFRERQARLHAGRTFDIQGMIVPPRFHGRTRELSRLDAFLEDPRSRAFLLVGLPGIGKTSVASRWVDGLKGRVHIVCRAVRPETTPGDLLQPLAGMFHDAGRPALAEALRRPIEGWDECVRVLKRDAGHVAGILVLDDAHAAGDGVASIVRELVSVDRKDEGLKVLLLGRERVPYLRAQDVAGGFLWETELDDLAPEDANALLAARGVDADRREAILQRCGGHPLSLELASAGGMSLEAVARASREWIAREVLARLDPDLRSALQLASIFERLAPRKLLGGRADRLVALGLLREVDGDRLDAHALIRDAAIRGLLPDRLAELHRDAARHLARGSKPEDVLEAVRHLTSAEDFDEATTLATDRGPEIVDAGLADSFLAALDRLVRASPGDTAPAGLHLLRGHALFALGRWSKAARAYERISRPDDAHEAAEAALGLAKSEVQRRSRRALPLLLASRDRLEALGSLRSLAEAQYWIGEVHQNAGRFREAQEAFELGRAIAFDVGDRRWEGLCAYGVGRLLSFQGEYQGAVDAERDALRLLERAGFRLEIAKACTGLGGNLVELNRLEEAEQYLARAIVESRATGAAGILAPCLYNLASLRKEAGRMEEAVPLLREALEAYLDQEQYDRAARCAAWLAYGARIKGTDEAGDRYAKQAEEFLTHVLEPAQRARTLLYIARSASQAGRKADARRQLVAAMVEARAAKLSRLEADLESEIERLD